jgi:integrase
MTVAEFVAVVAAGFGSATARTYRPYWRLLLARHGDTPIAEIGLVDLELVVADAVDRARRRRPDTAAPAAALVKPRRARSRRRALDYDELAQLVDAVRTTSRDPDLDLLLVRFHLETGARRQGALNLRPIDLDPKRATVWLREKGDNEREQPLSPSLVALLEAHHDDRAPGDVDGPLFRTRDGRPMSARRYDTIFSRTRSCLDWAYRTPVSAHVLRHTAITAVGRLAGYAVAQAFAGHTPPSVTGRYLHASLAEVASVATLTGEPHPLADGQVLRRCGRR